MKQRADTQGKVRVVNIPLHCIGCKLTIQGMPACGLCCYKQYKAICDILAGGHKEGRDDG